MSWNSPESCQSEIDDVPCLVRSFIWNTIIGNTGRSFKDHIFENAALHLDSPYRWHIACSEHCTTPEIQYLHYEDRDSEHNRGVLKFGFKKSLVGTGEGKDSLPSCLRSRWSIIKKIATIVFYMYGLMRDLYWVKTHKHAPSNIKNQNTKRFLSQELFEDFEINLIESGQGIEAITEAHMVLSESPRANSIEEQLNALRLRGRSQYALEIIDHSETETYGGLFKAFEAVFVAVAVDFKSRLRERSELRFHIAESAKVPQCPQVSKGDDNVQQRIVATGSGEDVDADWSGSHQPISDTDSVYNQYDPFGVDCVDSLDASGWWNQRRSS